MIQTDESTAEAEAEAVAVPETRTPAEILAEADAEIAEADARAEAIQQAVAEGRADVTLEQFEAAEKQSAWAKLRRKVAENRAEARALEIRKQAYERIVRDVVPKALADPTPEIKALLDQVKPLIEQAIELAHQRNVAVVEVTKFAIDPNTWKGEHGELSGYMQTPGPEMRNTYPTAQFNYGGHQARYLQATRHLGLMLASMRSDLKMLATTDRAWIDELPYR